MKRATWWIALAVLASARVGAAEEGGVRVVRRGDRLGTLAAEHGVSVWQLRRWNALVDDTIVVGQRLAVAAAAAPALRTVRRPTKATGAGAGAGAERAAGGGAGAAKAGRGGRAAAGRAGRAGGGRARKTAVAEPPSRSIGTPWGGSLEHARRLEPHPGYVIRDRARAWGTEETVTVLRRAFDDVARRFPRAPRVRVHDLSARAGGRLSGHRSHRSGRDVDLTYYQRRCPRGVCELVPVAPEALDPGPQWALFEALIRSGQVQLIFVDWELQRVLHRHARQSGASAAQLERWFQYPRARGTPVGVLRHFANHRNHVHVRFRCPGGSRQCQ